MGIFGWSLPPGCGSLPDEEEHALDLTELLPDLPADTYVFWMESDALIVTSGSEQEICIGNCAWDDDQTYDQNLARAAEVVRRNREHTK
jgi:hypothetical protein